VIARKLSQCEIGEILSIAELTVIKRKFTNMLEKLRVPHAAAAWASQSLRAMAFHGAELPIGPS